MNFKMIIGIVVLVLITIFTLQNAEVVGIRFLFWSFSVPRALVFFLIFLAGLLVGYLSGALTGRSHRKRSRN